MACLFGLSHADMAYLLRDCDHPRVGGRAENPNGFWRVDKDRDVELRHPVLTLIALHDLEAKIRSCGGDRKKGLHAFMSQNDGDGWVLPETVRLADFGLGHDERAEQPQPLASRLGPRFYEWQLAQSAEESWRECDLHVRNLHGETGHNMTVLSPHAARGAGERSAGGFALGGPFNPEHGQGELFGFVPADDLGSPPT